MTQIRRPHLLAGLLVCAVALSITPVRKLLEERPMPGAESKTKRIADTATRGESPGHAKRDRANNPAEVERWYQELLTKHPEFAIHYRDVAAKDNGYLQLLDFMETLASSRGLPDFAAIRDSMSSDGSPDLALVGKWLESHRDLFQEVLRLAELPDQSCKGIPAARFASATYAGDLQLLLSAQARLALESGDTAGALRSMAAAVNLTHHVDGVERPDMLHLVVGAGMRQSLSEAIMDGFAPALAGDPESLGRVRELLANTRAAMPDLSHVMLSEWHSGAPFFMSAMLGNEDAMKQLRLPNGEGIADPDAFLEAYSAHVQAFAKSLKPGQNFEALVDPQVPKVAADLPEAERAILDTMVKDLMVQIMRSVRLQQAELAMKEAALAILQGQEPPLEPLSGKPFLWDSASRTLSYPAEFEAADCKVEAMVLP